MKAYLIDFENVKSKGLTGIEQLGADDKIIIFYSENSDTISFDMHRRVMTSSADIEYLKVRVGGKNALDFQLSTLLGYLLAKGLYSHIFIISGDKGFDKLHDFWNVSFADRNSVTVFRTQTLAAAAAYAAAEKPEEPEPAPVPEPIPEPAPSADAEAQPEPVESQPPVEAAKPAPRKRSRRAHSASTMIRNALLGLFDLTDEDIAAVIECAKASTDKEDFHNALAKIFKQQATDLYKVLRPKYLRIREALDAEDTPVPAQAAPEAAVPESPAPETAAEPEEAHEEAPEQPEAIPEQAAAEEEPPRKTRKKTTRRKSSKAKSSPLASEIERRLSGECSEEEIAAVIRLFEETDTKQKLYLSIVKLYKKDRGCEIYKLVKSDYAALSKLKDEEG